MRQMFEKTPVMHRFRKKQHESKAETLRKQTQHVFNRFLRQKHEIRTKHSPTFWEDCTEPFLYSPFFSEPVTL